MPTRLAARPTTGAMLAASLIAALLAVADTGCGRPWPAEPTTAAPASEPSLADQAEAVRQGKSVLIRLDHTKVTDDDLSELDDLADKLERLNLAQADLTDTGLERISHLEHLVQLRLRSPRITDGGIAHLQQLKRLRHLHLLEVPLTGAGLALLHPLATLDSLYLDGTRATDAALVELKKALPKAHLHVDGGHHRTGAPDSDPRHQH